LNIDTRSCARVCACAHGSRGGLGRWGSHAYATNERVVGQAVRARATVLPRAVAGADGGGGL
jgi:hypothetical protein